MKLRFLIMEVDFQASIWSRISLFGVPGNQGRRLDDEGTSIPKLLSMATGAAQMRETEALLAHMPSPIRLCGAPWHATSAAGHWCDCPEVAALAWSP